MEKQNNIVASHISRYLTLLSFKSTKIKKQTLRSQHLLPSSVWANSLLFRSFLRTKTSIKKQTTHRKTAHSTFYLWFIDYRMRHLHLFSRHLRHPC